MNRESILAVTILLAGIGYAFYSWANRMKLSKAGADFIKGYEKLSLKRYIDAGGYATIGWGHKITPKDGDLQIITPHQADVLFLKDTAAAQFCVNGRVRVPLTQQQFDALVSLVYNIGCGNFRRSTLLKLLNAGDYEGAANEFPKWRKSSGKILAGLERRRASEQQIFMT